MRAVVLTQIVVLLLAPAIMTPVLAADYPETRRGDVIDDYHGTKVADPYRWLEDDVRESKDVAQWVAAQNKVTFAYLEKLDQRERIRQRITELWDYDEFYIPSREGDRYFYYFSDGLKNQRVLYMQESLDSDPKLIIDPNTWSDDGTIAMASATISPDGKLVAYSIQDGGSDWRIWKILDIDKNVVLDDELKWLKFTTVAWMPDSSGLFYARFPEPPSGEKFQALNLNQAVYFHKLDTDQADDVLFYARPDHPDWRYWQEVSEDGRYLVVTMTIGTDNRYQVLYKDLHDVDAQPVMLIDGFENDYTFIHHEQGRFYFFTDFAAPKARLIAIDIHESDSEKRVSEIIPESDDVLVDVSLVGGLFVAEYLHDARSVVRVYDKRGKQIREIKLPGHGSASGFEGKPDNPETFYRFASFNVPNSVYRYDVVSGETTLWQKANVDFDSDRYTVRQYFYSSKDGTKIPIFITHRKGLKLDGSHPTLLYGYGGFNISQRPIFRVSRAAWLEMGGVYAVANLRGGGEYGEEWHQGGTKLNKQNVFDDFIAAGEFLIEKGYTSKEHLGIYGRSNGGLLVGAVTNQRPELFAAALPGVGVMDMLRFQHFTAGQFWVDDYGSSDNADEFKALYAYSPYHNAKKGTEYPAILVTTADYDDRVVPAHSFKYTAAIQAVQTADEPVLIRIETRAGHGLGKPTDKIIAEVADLWAFLANETGLVLADDYGR